MNRWIHFCAAAIALGALSVPAAGLAQDKVALASRLHASDVDSALDTADLKPWHLKMTVQLFDEKGDPSDHGIIEEWWSAPGVDRRQYKTVSYTATEIRNGDKFYRTKDAGPPPYYLALLLEQAFHPMPNSSEIEESSPELRKDAFGSVVLECVMLSQPIKKFGLLPLGLFPTYCFDPDKDVLRASYEFGDQIILRNLISPFQGKAVAHDITVMSERIKAASSQMVKLEETTLPDSEFGLSDDVSQQDMKPVRVSGGVSTGYAIKTPPPVYPASSLGKHISGVVVLHALIGTDGHVHALQIISTPDPDLAIAAIVAVRKWVYRPYLLAGVPTDVETTININFALGPG